MAMNLIVLLTFMTACSANDSLDEVQPIFNFTGNGTSSFRSFADASNESYDSDDDLFDSAVADKDVGSFWDAWESHNQSALASYTILSPLSTTQMAVTEASGVTTSPGGDELTTPAAVTAMVTAYPQEDQVGKPLADTWPVKLAAEVPGDLIIGGLMMVHEREDTITCGPIMPQGGIQAVETMLYTLDTVNKALEHFSIGVHILDDCDKDTYGLEMAVDFIKAHIMKTVRKTKISGRICAGRGRG